MTEHDNSARLLSELNSSGFPFQHAVVQAFHRSHAWKVHATEFPVSYAGGSTHIDIVAMFPRGVAMVAECKRANPAFANWFFLRSPFTFHPRSTRAAWFDRLHAQPANRPAPYLDVVSPHPSIESWHIALEVKTKAQGDPKGQGRTLTEALKQVHLSANGFIASLVEQHYILQKMQRAIVLPVIFTTARLLTSTARLSQADLRTGTIESLDELKEEKWLFFESNVSPELLAPKIPRDAHEDVITVGHLLAQKHARTVIFVTATAIEEFLRYGMDALEAGGALNEPKPGRRSW